jgi:hypothetical protein
MGDYSRRYAVEQRKVRTPPDSTATTCVDGRARFFSCLGAGTLLLAAEEGGQGHVRHLHNLEPGKKGMPFKICLVFTLEAKIIFNIIYY